MALKVMKKIVSENDQDQDETSELVTKDANGYTMINKVKRPEGTRYYKSTGFRPDVVQKQNRFKIMSNPADSVASSSLSKVELEKLNKK